MANRVFLADNLNVLPQIPSESVDLVYIDPPFNTGKRQYRDRVSGVSFGFADNFDDYLGFLSPRLEEAYRVLKPSGSFFIHLDYREVHYVKVYLDKLFGRRFFRNEIIWAYDYGARSKKRWSAKHDTILWYTKSNIYTFNYDAMDRIPYMAPGLVGKEKAKRGKTPTDVWWHTIVSPTGKEKTGYATQKPVGVIRRIVSVHSNAGDIILDFFAGSGTVGVVAAELGREFVLVDNNPEAVSVMIQRFAEHSIEAKYIGVFPRRGE